MSENRKDVVIIGSGPAGLSASIYAKRAMLDVIVVEREMFSGGQIVTTDRVDNLLGFYGETGYDLSVKFREHADALEVPFFEGNITHIADKEDCREVQMEDGTTIETKAVIVATGATHRKLGVEGETRLSGAGVSYCATCDGAFFRKKTVAVVGGGDVALEDALYLANLCEKVYLIHRRDELRGAKILQQRIFDTANIEFLANTEVREICGENMVDYLVIENNRTSMKSELSVSGVFIAVGMLPQSDFVKELLKTENGYICAGEDCRTSRPFVYAVGDIRTKTVRQIATAIGDGAAVIASLEQDLYKG